MNDLVVSLIIILLPGIVAAIICDKIAVHSRWNSFKFGLYSIMFGVTSYAFLQFLIYFCNWIKSIFCAREVVWTNLKVWSSVTDHGAISPSEVLASVVLALPIAYLGAFLINYKIFNKIARKLRVSFKYGDENLYTYYLNSKEVDWVYVRDPQNGFTYEGRVVSYSENDKLQEIVLSEVTVYYYEDSSRLYSVPTIYLSRELGKIIIEAIPKENLGMTI